MIFVMFKYEQVNKMEIFEKIKHGAVIAYMEGQPISPNQYYVSRLLKMINYESM